MGERVAERTERSSREAPSKSKTTRRSTPSPRARAGAAESIGNRATGRLLARARRASTGSLEAQADGVVERTMPRPGEAGHVARGASFKRASSRPRLGDGPAFASRLSALGPGSPLDGATRRTLESRLDADLGHVRVHAGPKAAALSRDAGAKALTHGRNIVMGRGRHAPHSPEGRRLLTHEIAHTFQQGAPIRTRSGSAPGPGHPLAGLRRVSPRIQREDEEEVTGMFKDSKRARIRARAVLADLKARNWGAALEKYRDDDISYSKAAFLGGAGWVKWFRGTSGTLNTARKDAKALADKSTKAKAETKHLADVAKVADTAHTAADIGHFWGTNYEHSADMAKKIVYYLVHALPQSAVHQGLRDHILSKATKAQSNPVAVLMMGGSGAGKSRVRALSGVTMDEMVHVDADDVKALLPNYRDRLHAGDKDAAWKSHGESQQVVTGLLAGAIADKQHLLYDATGANNATYEGGFGGGVAGRDGLFKMLAKQGYTIKLIMTYVPTEIAVGRVEKRGEETGRVVPEHVVRSTHRDARRNFMQYAQDSRVSEAKLYENMGEGPLLVWEKGSGRMTRTEQLVLKQHLGELSDGEYYTKLSAFRGGFDQTVNARPAVGKAESWHRKATTETEHDEATPYGLMGKYRLTKAEAAAIYIYTASDYTYINPGLAGNEAWMQATKGSKTKTLTPQEHHHLREEGWTHARFAISGMRKLPDWTGTTWRGAGFTADEINTKFRPGRTWTTPAFLSTSLNKMAASGFASQNTHGDKIGVFFETELTKGKDVMPFSDMKHEKEILVAPWSSFTVRSVTDQTAGTVRYKKVVMRQTD